MYRDWRKIVASVAVIIAVLGMVVPDACADDAVAVALGSASVSVPHTGNQPFGCQHEEDCFCCAHIAPTALFALLTFVVAISTVEKPTAACVEQVLSRPYHPPRA